MINELLTQCEADRPIGILYDIGCSLDKYMGARELLAEHRPRLSFGTSVFHAYVHNWVCQLQYHPRLNDGWGLSDGEVLDYVHLKIRTNNWSNVNTYADHTNCKCPPHLQTRRPVDLVDING
ncbi:hypothetical protein PSTG_18493 [Puccinia striiformis f. sp. tritici PST-78]|uniref:CxC1-like cysteine cluster associated with KDZ transposases domain-containing protein n=1 Tax=Puccinia striiformis f. sp. tritici PST-78 TaxID=1165861 RepID=A0A0L0UM18_9BASI|nr:hypothetical protein PSTG_18493 [Puccinia striiformis f. sp. tritici PST-78]